MSRRRRWKPPNDPTAPARQVWAALFPGHPWPTGWRVRWVGFMRGASGLCCYGTRRILLNHSDAKRTASKDGPVATLLHEFVHLRTGGRVNLRHGREFAALENNLRERLGLPPLVPVRESETIHWIGGRTTTRSRTRYQLPTEQLAPAGP